MDVAKVAAICGTGALALFLLMSGFAAILIKIRDRKKRRDIEEARRRRQYHVYQLTDPFPSRNRLKKKTSRGSSLSAIELSHGAQGLSALASEDINLLVQCVSESNLFDPSRPQSLPTFPPSCRRPSHHRYDSSKSILPLKRLSSIIESPKGHPASRDNTRDEENLMTLSPPGSPSASAKASKVVKGPAREDDAVKEPQRSRVESDRESRSHSRSFSLSSQRSNPPDEPLPPLPAKRVRDSNLLIVDPGSVDQSGSRVSMSSVDTIGSSILGCHTHKHTHHHSFVIPDAIDENLQAQAGSSHLGGMPVNQPAATVRSPQITTPRDQEKVFSSHCIWENSGSGSIDESARANILSSSILNSPLSSKCLTTAHGLPSGDVASQRRSVKAIKSGPRSRSRNCLTTASGSPEARHRSSIIQSYTCFSESSAQPSKERRFVEEGPDGKCARFSQGTFTGKPSNLKGSPNAKKGHRRQAAVRIVSKPISFSIPRSRESSMPSVLEQDEDVQSLPSSTCLPTVPSLSNLDPQLTVRPLTVRNSTTSSTALPKKSRLLQSEENHASRPSLISSFEPIQGARPASSSTSSLLSLSAWPTHDGVSMRSPSPLRESEAISSECMTPRLHQHAFDGSGTPPETVAPDLTLLDKSPTLPSPQRDRRNPGLQFPQLDFSPSRSQRKHNDLDSSHLQRNNPQRNSIVMAPPVFKLSSRQRPLPPRPCPLSSRIGPYKDGENKPNFPNPLMNPPVLSPPIGAGLFVQTDKCPLLYRIPPTENNHTDAPSPSPAFDVGRTSTPSPALPNLPPHDYETSNSKQHANPAARPNGAQPILKIIQGLRRQDSTSSSALSETNITQAERRYLGIGTEMGSENGDTPARRTGTEIPNFSMRVITPTRSCDSALNSTFKGPERDLTCGIGIMGMSTHTQSNHQSHCENGNETRENTTVAAPLSQSTNKAAFTPTEMAGPNRNMAIHSRGSDFWVKNVDKIQTSRSTGQGGSNVLQSPESLYDENGFLKGSLEG